MHRQTLYQKVFHQTELAELYAALGANAGGLTSEDALLRLSEYGPNRLEIRGERPEWIKFLLQFKNFFAVLLVLGGCLALLADYLDPGQGNLYIAYALFGVVLLNAAFTYLQEHQSEKIMESFRNMLPPMVTVLRDGHADRIDAMNVVPGDILLLYEGDRVPADGRLIEANRFEVDLSSLTGESEPQELDAAGGHNNLLESRNVVFSGTLVQAGDAKVLVCATGMATQIGNIVALTKSTAQVETPIRRELNHFIKIISSIAIALGVLFFAVSLAIGNGGLTSLIFAIGIIVANVPEGLLPTVTLSLTMASKRMADRNALIKNLESVETLGSTTVICSDKTGTLTQNRLSVSTFAFADRAFGADDVSIKDDPRYRTAWRVMVDCNNAHLVGDGYTGDATDGALLIYADRLGPLDGGKRSARIAEIPFDYTKKRMLTLVKLAAADTAAVEGYEAQMKGAPEVVLDLCSQILIGAECVALTTALREQVMAQYEEMAARGERGLALARRDTLEPKIPEDDYCFIGIAGMQDPPRPGVSEAIASCHSAGIRVFMLTGDYGPTAAAISRQIGLFTDGGAVIHGDELTAMSADELSDKLHQPAVVFARISPSQKLDIVQALQAQGEIVTVTGDGVNDAPALKNADIGVAMGINGTEVAKEASKMVLMDDNFATLAAAVEEGRTIFDNIKKFIAYILTSNIPEILPFIAFVLLDIPLPLTIVLILCIDLGTDILPALGLGAEKAETDVMHKPPRKRNERLLTRNLLFMSYAVIGVIQAAAGFFTYFMILFAGGWEWGQDLANSDPLYRTAITGFFASIVICQIADVIICRTRRQSLFSVGFLSNRLVLLGIASELLLLGLIAYVPAFNTFFGTAPLELWQLSLSVPFAIFILVFDETRRVFVRRGSPFVLKWLTW